MASEKNSRRHRWDRLRGDGEAPASFGTNYANHKRSTALTQKQDVCLCKSHKSQIFLKKQKTFGWAVFFEQKQMFLFSVKPRKDKMKNKWKSER